jgi:hypothetical protein
MSKPPDTVWKLSDTLSLCEYTDPRNGAFGFWLYDETRGMNLSIRAKTERDAFIEALTFYQKRFGYLEGELKSLQGKVDKFVAQFVEIEE